MRVHTYAAPLLGAIGTAFAGYEPQIDLALAASATNAFKGLLDVKPTALASTPRVQIAAAQVAAASCSSTFWMETISHQGRAAFNSNPSGYTVFRNVKDYGAKGDGTTDDTAAIQLAISAGSRCAPGSCQSTTTTPAVVYFPAGIYAVSKNIIDYYYTMMIGNPNCMPTIKALANFTSTSGSIGIIDGDPYGSSGNLEFGATNIFWRQIRNFYIDLTAVAASSNLAGVHWPTGQATSLQNIVFQMSQASGTQHVGVFIESGSGGYMNDLVFNGGNIGLNVGNQQFTMRNLTFNNVVTAVNQLWDWGWTYQGLTINNCQKGIDFSAGGSSAINTGSITLLDSTISNTPVGLVTARISGSNPPAAGSLIMENVRINNVNTAILQGPNNQAIIAGTTGSTTVNYIAGNAYTPTGPSKQAGNLTPNNRPASLVSGSNYYARSKPQYGNIASSGFLSARSAGAKGDGSTDDTSALQTAINNAKSQGKVLYVDHGDYLVTSTIYIPAGSKIVGEAYSVILSSGIFFNSQSNPQPVVRIGNAGESGSVEWSDMIVSTRGQQQGAILIEYNLQSPAGTPTGLWDVHTRIGGFAGSNLQNSQCPKTPGTTITGSNLVQNCISGFISVHITKNSAGLYLENVWLWVADHDVEDPALSQITIYAGRGLLDESVNGPVWLVGTAVEHHSRYQYQFANAKNVFQGQIQTETAYYQPDPNARIPFPQNQTWFDPTWNSTDFVNTNNTQIPYPNGWGIRIINSQNILTYGAGHYSFFNNYSTTCSDQGQGVRCQAEIVSVEGSSSGISIYNLNTVGTHWPITLNGTTGVGAYGTAQDVAFWQDNQDGFVQTIALFRK